MTDLGILALRYGGVVVLVLCVLWAAASILMFNVDMKNARLAITKQKRFIEDLFFNLTFVVMISGAAGFAIILSFTLPR